MSDRRRVVVMSEAEYLAYRQFLRMPPPLQQAIQSMCALEVSATVTPPDSQQPIVGSGPTMSLDAYPMVARSTQ
jgi:hypothetical protein